jgi:hypothetical protein
MQCTSFHHFGHDKKLIFPHWSICHDVFGDAPVSYLVIAHAHRHGHYRSHRFNTGDIRLSQPLDKGQHAIDFIAKMLDFFLRNCNAREVRDPADSLGVNGHDGSLGLIERLRDTPAIAEGQFAANCQLAP